MHVLQPLHFASNHASPGFLILGPVASMNGGNDHDDDSEEWLQELITYNREAPCNCMHFWYIDTKKTQSVVESTYARIP